MGVCHGSTEVRLSPTAEPDEYTLRAARGGNRPARQAVVAGYLPLVYNAVGWALPGAADEPVRRAVLRVLGDLHTTRDPDRTRSVVLATALREIRAGYRHRPPGGTRDFVDLAVTRLGLSGQVRAVAEATRRLEPGDRELVGLWWLAASGAVRRADLATALGLPVTAVDARLRRVADRLGVGDPEKLLAGLPLVAPPAELAQRLARVAAAHPRLHRWTARHAAVASRLHITEPVTAAVASLVLVAGAGLAIVLTTRADGQPPAVAAARASATAAATSPPPPTPSPAASVAPDPAMVPFSDQLPAVPTVLSAAELGPIQQHARISARDNGQSTGYGGQSVWIFDDTVLRDPWGFVANTGAITADLDAADGITLTATNPYQASVTSGPDELMHHSGAELAFEAAHAKAKGCTPAGDRYCGARFAFWPGPVVADPARHRLLLFYHKLCREAADGGPCSGPYGQALGSGVAALDMTTGKVSRLTPTPAPRVPGPEGVDPTLFFPPSGEYTSAALAIGGTVYVYGDCQQECKLARVPLAQVADLSRWRYFAGRDDNGRPLWTADPDRAADTVEAGAAGNTVLPCPAMRAYLNFYMPFGTNTLMFQIGGSPFGPWSAPQPIVTTPASTAQPNYAAFGHVEYAQRGGLIQYVTYYQPATGALRLLKITFYA